MIVIDLNFSLRTCVCTVFYCTSERADTSCEGRAAVGGPVLQHLLRSQCACHHPIHTSIRPPAHLSVTARSPTSLVKPFIGGLVQVLASIWHTAHVHKHVKCRAAYCCVVCMCQCLFRGYGTLYFSCRLMAVTSH